MARDGDVIAHIPDQMQMLSHDPDALAVVSIGGNDCLGLLNGVDMSCIGYDANDPYAWFGWKRWVCCGRSSGCYHSIGTLRVYVRTRFPFSSVS